ncbi:MAG: hypothetical protein AAF633_04725 [Chloroflexota bacterium]
MDQNQNSPIKPQAFFKSGIDILEQFTKQPTVSAKYVSQYLAECARVIGGQSTVKPSKGDRRFADPIWQENAFLKRAMQIHLVADQICQAWAEESFADEDEKERAKAILNTMTDAFSPSNSILNPVLLRRIVETRGGNVIEGFQKLGEDMLNREDISPFKPGRSINQLTFGDDIAPTQTKLIFNCDQLELIRFETAEPSENPIPKTSEPLLFIPSHLNKYYIFDLTAEQSVVAFGATVGFQPYAIRWKEPQMTDESWGLSDYVFALIEALKAISAEPSADGLHLFATGTSGIVGLLTAAYLEASPVASVKIKTTTLFATILDATESAPPPPSPQQESSGIPEWRNIFSGEELSQLYTWLRPESFTWTSRISHYFTGSSGEDGAETAWLEDTQMLSTLFHTQLVDLHHRWGKEENGGLSIGEITIHLETLAVPLYAVAGIDDHINPWGLCYKLATLIEDEPTFVLSSGDLMGSLLNLPQQESGFFYSNPDLPRTHTAWKETAYYQEGSWWTHWLKWIKGQ